MTKIFLYTIVKIFIEKNSEACKYLLACLPLAAMLPAYQLWLCHQPALPACLPIATVPPAVYCCYAACLPLVAMLPVSCAIKVAGQPCNEALHVNTCKGVTGCIQSVDWWTGLDWTGMEWNGMEWTGLDQNRKKFPRLAIQN